MTQSSVVEMQWISNELIFATNKAKNKNINKKMHEKMFTVYDYIV